MMKMKKNNLKLLWLYFWVGLWETIGKPLTIIFMLALFLGVIEGTWLQ